MPRFFPRIYLLILLIQDDADYELPRKARRRHSSDDTSSEDGEVDKREEDREAERAAETVTVDDLSRARITRDMLAKNCLTPWFEDLVKGRQRTSQYLRRFLT